MCQSSHLHASLYERPACITADGLRASGDVVSGNATVKQSASRGRVDLPLELRCGVNHDRLPDEGFARCWGFSGSGVESRWNYGAVLTIIDCLIKGLSSAGEA